MTHPTIKVQWEFDIESDNQTQELIRIDDVDVEYKLNHDHEWAMGVNGLLCNLYGVPEKVDLNSLFNDNVEISNDMITDALSDEFGWLVKTYYEV